jgi:5-oxoprolinase (ATP-hydrolysing)
MTATLLSSHRITAPYGLQGGGPGQCGENILLRRDGRKYPLAGNDEVQVEAGDMIVIKTPGGGGFGSPDTKGNLE